MSKPRILAAGSLEVIQNSLHIMMRSVIQVLEQYGLAFRFISKQSIPIFHFLVALTMHFLISTFSHSMYDMMGLQNLLNRNDGELFPVVRSPGV